MADLVPFRVGVAGSRAFASLPVIRAALAEAWELGQPGQPRILVHGQCDPRHPDTLRMIPWAMGKRVSWEVQGRYHGTDWLAEWAAIDTHHERLWTIERHPADWQAPCRPECQPGHRRRKGRGPEYCPAAGNYRNQEMVDAGADVWLAFFKAGASNSGTSDAARRAKRAGIEVRRLTA